MTTLPQKMTREEVAKLEIGHTDIHHGLAALLVVAFLALVSAPGGVQLLWEQRAYVRGERPTWRPQCVEIFLRMRAVRDAWRPDAGGSVIHRLKNVNAALLREIHAYEDRLENESVFARALRRPSQYVLTAMLGVGNEKSYCGEHPWLFYRPDVDHIVRPGFLDPAQLAARASSGTEWRAPPQPNPVSAIVAFRDQLAERGIQLVVMPVPVKPMIHPDALFAGAGRYPRYNSSWTEFLEALRQQGVIVFDATPYLAEHRGADGNAFLETDSHWTPEAMQQIARELAFFLRHNRLAPEQKGKLSDRLVSVVGAGDLVTMLQLPKHAPAYPPESVKLRQILGARGEVWRPDSKAEILLLGDSFANIYSLDALGWGASAGFAEQLSFELGAPLDVIAINDNGAYASRDQLARELKRGRNRLAGKRLVIYEFAARELSEGDWRIIPLELGTPPARRFVTPPKGEVWRVRATVLSLGSVPLPGTVPYKDHVVAVHLGDVRAVDGEAIQGSEALCYFLSMKDHKWTHAARWRVGDEIAVILRPWSDVAATYEGINRNELDDEEMQWAEPCWGELPLRAELER